MRKQMRQKKANYPKKVVDVGPTPKQPTNWIGELTTAEQKAGSQNTKRIIKDGI